jgi:cytochrome c
MKIAVTNKRVLLTVLTVFTAVVATHIGYDTMCILPDDAQRGKEWTPTCKACHDITAYYPPPSASGGPNLQYAYMSLAGTQPRSDGHDHYPPLIAARDAGVVWTDENLFNYLRDPKGFLEKATGKSFNLAYYMNFFIGQERARWDVISYLRAIKTNPRCN